jgi:DNA invertase Pin-like site-specific DNA recombinase
MMSEKIRSTHLERTAYVYVRQSTVQQVRHHQEGQQRQYALADHAHHLGFRRTQVIDDDLGRSGSGRQERPGFARLLAAVCDGTAGAVFALEASRLARNNRDWHHLVDLCALTDTLLVDYDGVYDPRHLNDRLLLGLKGTMSEFELGLLKQRAYAARMQMIHRGAVLWDVPVGYVRGEDHAIEIIPDRQVQEAIRGVFAKFRELGSARQVTLWHRDDQIPLPHLTPGTRGHEISWKPPALGRVYQMLKNPCYAGAFAYGRTASRTVVREERPRTSHGHKTPRDAWQVLLRDHHPGYISWDEYLRNQEILEANVARRAGESSGAPKSGPALLSGLLRCGRCGRKLQVVYGGNGGRVPRYSCSGGRVLRGSGACLKIGSFRLDEAVAAQALEAVQPIGLEAALAAGAQDARQDDDKRKALALALEKARYHAARAQRQYDAADPDNRLVAGELETRWNHALQQVAELEARVQASAAARPSLHPGERDRLVELGADLQQLWTHPAASASVKKRILRTVLNEIVLDVSDDPPRNLLWLHWSGGVHTQLSLPRNRSGQHGRAAGEDAVELMRELAAVCNDRTIATVLNRLGYRTGHGLTWRSSRVAGVRNYHGIPPCDPSPDRLTLEQVAEILQVSNTVVRRLIKDEVLPARQLVPYAPWVIRRQDLALRAVQAAAQAVRDGHKLPRTAPDHPELPLESGR